MRPQSFGVRRSQPPLSAERNHNLARDSGAAVGVTPGVEVSAGSGGCDRRVPKRRLWPPHSKPHSPSPTKGEGVRGGGVTTPLHRLGFGVGRLGERDGGADERAVSDRKS